MVCLFVHHAKITKWICVKFSKEVAYTLNKYIGYFYS